MNKAVVISLLAVAFGGAAISQADTALSKAQQTEMVKAHAKWRQEVGVEPLQWSPALADTAQAWADHLKTTQGCKPTHSGNQYGENLYWASALTWTDGRRELQKVLPTKVVNSWGNEKADYNYATNSCSPGKECLHYTQVVSRFSKEVGCGMAICPDKSQIWVCNYNPPGNYIGQKPY